jgi:dihydropteroate synthase
MRHRSVRIVGGRKQAVRADGPDVRTASMTSTSGSTPFRFPTLATPLGRGVVRPAGAATGIVGILNVTPDSFSDGGELRTVEDCVRKAEAMIAEGACALDVGGESTRPGAAPVGEEEERARVVPVVQELARRFRVPLSVDTTKAAVFREAFDAGASILNDVSALGADEAMAEAVARTDAAVILMHRRGTAANMAEHARYDNVVAEVAEELARAVGRAHRAGIADERIVLDPGLGFAKTAEHNWQLLGRLESVRMGRHPLMIGPSRKAFLGAATGRDLPRDRDVATAVVVAACALRGVELVRVHDVAGARDAIAVAAALSGTWGPA